MDIKKNEYLIKALQENFEEPDFKSKRGRTGKREDLN